MVCSLDSWSLSVLDFEGPVSFLHSGLEFLIRNPGHFFGLYSWVPVGLCVSQGS